MAFDTDAFAYSAGELNAVSSGKWVKLRTGGQNADVKATGDFTGVGTTDAPYYYNVAYASGALYSQIKYKTLAAGAEFSVIINCATALDAARSYNLFEVTEAAGVYNLLIGKVVAGTFTSLATKNGVSVSAGDVFRLENDGAGNLAPYINGVLVTGWTGTLVDTANNAHVRVGVMPSSVSVERLDDWEGGDLPVAPPTTAAMPFMTTIGYQFV